MRRCVDCGASIDGRPIAAYLCPDCRLQRIRAKGRREQQARRDRGGLPYYGSGRVKCAVEACTQTFIRTAFNLSRLFCADCSVFYARARKREAKLRYIASHPNYYADQAAYARERYRRRAA